MPIGSNHGLYEAECNARVLCKINVKMTFLDIGSIDGLSQFPDDSLYDCNEIGLADQGLSWS